MLTGQEKIFLNTIPYADENGAFYCRIIHSILQEEKNQHVCGKGCPYYQGLDESGNHICGYLEEQIVKKIAEKKQEKQIVNHHVLFQNVQVAIEKKETELFPTFDTMSPLLWKAYSYAATMHEGQVRKGTTIPYFSHLITTMNYILELTEDENILAAAVLHDTLEDTFATLLEIQIRFGSQIASYVAADTENKRLGIPADQSWEERKLENISHLQNASKEVKMIVLADKTANAESMAREWSIFGDDLWQKFNQKDKRKQGWYYKSCANAMGELSDTSVMKSFRAYIGILFD